MDAFESANFFLFWGGNVSELVLYIERERAISKRNLKRILRGIGKGKKNFSLFSLFESAGIKFAEKFA